LVNALSQFLDEEVKMVLYSLLTEKEVAVTAYKKLLKFGISQQEIALHLDSITNYYGRKKKVARQSYLNIKTKPLQLI